MNIMDESSRVIFSHKFTGWVFNLIRFFNYLKFLIFKGSFGVSSYQMSSRFDRFILEIIWGECWENGPNRHLTKNFFLTLLDVDLVGEHFLLNIESILA